MARKTTARKLEPPQAVLDGFEVEAEIFSLPVILEEEPGQPYHPAFLILVAVRGPILFQEMGRAETLAASAGVMLRAAMKKLPFLPEILRVASPELAETLRPQITPRVRLVCEPTPHLDEAVAVLSALMTREMSYLDFGLDPLELGAFFGVAARFYRAKPWALMPPGQLIGVTVEDLGVDQAALLLIAPEAEMMAGFMLAENPESFVLLAKAIEASSDDAGFPVIASFKLEEILGLPPGIALEIRRYGWETADGRCPWVSLTGTDGEPAPTGEEELAVSMAIAQALSELATSAGPVKKALAGKTAPFALLTSVEIFGGRTVEVSITVPYVKPRSLAPRPDHPLLARLYDLELDPTRWDERGSLEAELLELFAAALPGEVQGTFEYVQLVLDLAADRLGRTAGSIGGFELESLLFDAFPRFVNIAPAEAAPFAAECTAFFGFLRDDCGHALADDALAVLEGENVVARLEAAFADTSLFGLGKTLLVSGAAAGFDVDSPEGLRAYMRQVEERGIPPGAGIDPRFEGLEILSRAGALGKAAGSSPRRRPRR